MDAGEIVALGRTDLRTTRLGLGLASLGGMFAPVSLEDSLQAIDAAWELGVRLFDTAPVYGYGRSEERAGLALGPRPRDEFVLCTKVGRLIEPGGADTQEIWVDPPPGVGPRLDYSHSAVLRSLEESLERLALDRIDVLHIHDPDQNYQQALAEAFPALVELRRRGTIGAVSLGVNHADVAARFLRDVAEGGLDCILLAGRYTLLDQSGAHELLPLCRDRGVAVMAAGVFHGGALADPSPDAPKKFGHVSAELSARLDALRAVCDRFGVPPLAAAIQYPFGHPSVSTVIVGARSAREVRENAALLGHEIPTDFWTALQRHGLVPRTDAPRA